MTGEAHLPEILRLYCTGKKTTFGIASNVFTTGAMAPLTLNVSQTRGEGERFKAPLNAITGSVAAQTLLILTVTRLQHPGKGLVMHIMLSSNKKSR